MSKKVFVTGATGNVGSQVVKYLLEAGQEVIGAKRTEENPKEAAGLTWLSFDFTNTETWEASLEGVSRVFLMRPPHISKIKRDMAPYMAFIKEKGINHIVFMSVQGAERNKMVPHYDIEQTCIELDLPWTFIRPSFFMQNLTTTHLDEIRNEKMVFTPTGQGRTNFIDVRDIGEVVARVLCEKGHQLMAYTVTGAKSYSYQEISNELSRELETPIRFENPGPVKFIVRNLKEGRKLAMTMVMLFLYTIVKFGKGDITTDDTELILQREPRSLEAFIADNRRLFLGEAG